MRDTTTILQDGFMGNLTTLRELQLFAGLSHFGCGLALHGLTGAPSVVGLPTVDRIRPQLVSI